jgi:hypothetical protein
VQGEHCPVGDSLAHRAARLHYPLEVLAHRQRPTRHDRDEVERGPGPVLRPAIRRLGRAGDRHGDPAIGLGVCIPDRRGCGLDRGAEGALSLGRQGADSGRIARDGVPAPAALQGDEPERRDGKRLAQRAREHLDRVRAAAGDSASRRRERARSCPRPDRWGCPVDARTPCPGGPAGREPAPTRDLRWPARARRSSGPRPGEPRSRARLPSRGHARSPAPRDATAARSWSAPRSAASTRGARARQDRGLGRQGTMWTTTTFVPWLPISSPR